MRRGERILRAAILGGFAAYFGWLLQSGTLTIYVHPRFAKFSWFAAAFFAALAVFEAVTAVRGKPNALPGRLSGRALSTYGMIALPILIAAVVPPMPLGASAIARRGLVLSTPAALGSAQFEQTDMFEAPVVLASDHIVVTDDVFVQVMDELMYFAPEQFIGRTLEYVGFVYREEGMAPNEMAVVRLAIACCAADAAPTGLLVRYDGAADLAVDTWVRVKGRLAMGRYFDMDIPVLEDVTIETVEVPPDPYIF